MLDKLEQIIAYDAENQRIEFKEEEYKLGTYYKKHELLKDISAMANHPSKEDKFIIIGIIEENGQAVGFKSVQKSIDEANYQQFINEYIEPGINFEYIPFEYKGYDLAYFRVYNNNRRPYLLKKEFRNAKDNKKIEYRAGDGFIRKGTTVKKITREDLEEIYKSRFLAKDRKSDIKVSAVLINSEDDILSKYNLKCIDVKVENRSNKSIAIDDIELIIEKTEDIKITTESNARKAFKEINREKNDLPGPFSFRMPILDTEIGLPYTYITELDNQYLVSKIKMRYESKAVTIPQQGIDHSVFGKDIIILFEGADMIRGEIILRCDDFTEGAFRTTFEINI